MIQKTEQEIMQLWPREWNEPLVSIWCLAYNHARFIAQTLDGFLMQQTNFPFEIVVHDDASIDNTADIIREYEKKYPTIIKPIYESENQFSKFDGSIGRIMDAKCHGKYIAFCEGDDYWISPQKLQMQVDILEKNKDVSMVHTNFICVDENGSKINRKYHDSLYDESKKERGLVSLFKKNHIMTLSIVLRREIVLSSLFKKCPCQFDYALFFTAAFYGKVKYISYKMGAYRKHSSSLIQSKSSMVYHELKKAYLYFAEYFLNTFIDLPLKDMLSINFQIMTHVMIYKNIRFLVNMIMKNPLKILLTPFAFFYVVYQRLFA